MRISTTCRFMAVIVVLRINSMRTQAIGEISQSRSIASHRASTPTQEPENAIFRLPTEADTDWTDVPYLDTEPHNLRLDPSIGLYTNTIHSWPSIGGIIIAERVHPVELAYIGLDRFHSTPRSSNTTEEDLFCTQLRRIGGKWWNSWWDYQEATKSKMRMMWPNEREVLFLGWPEAGGRLAAEV
ncbi:hypothetical protein BKA64DRAFT_405561 [Cadophora sp. MPI-SDFR-AT-0126]|nr:hypothetical protein BKA64DRAFT_405561 [Leotiomycetes sp. MPI-SDFR-AT-0126]